jgi:hypothetical protein
MTGHITVEKVEEHEDGSATVVFECDDEAKKQLINEGLISLLEKSVRKEWDDTQTDIEEYIDSVESGERMGAV